MSIQVQAFLFLIILEDVIVPVPTHNTKLGIKFGPQEMTGVDLVFSKF